MDGEVGRARVPLQIMLRHDFKMGVIKLECAVGTSSIFKLFLRSSFFNRLFQPTVVIIPNIRYIERTKISVNAQLAVLVGNIRVM